MADEKKSFSELLSAAPLAAAEDTITLVGALERSQQPDKFVLVLGGGRSVTLEIDAVKDYRMLGGGVGQLLVQVDLDRERVPRELAIGAVAPFALATPHHAPQGVAAGTQAWPGGVNVFGGPTLPLLDPTSPNPNAPNGDTSPLADVHLPKLPIFDPPPPPPTTFGMHDTSVWLDKPPVNDISTPYYTGQLD